MSDELDDLLDDYAGDKKEEKTDKKEEKQEETKEEESVSNDDTGTEDDLGLDDVPKEKKIKKPNEETADDTDDELGEEDEEEKKEEGKSKALSGGKDKKETEEEVSADDLMDAPEGKKKSRVKKLSDGEPEEIEVGEAVAPESGSTETKKEKKERKIEERKEERKKRPITHDDFDYSEDDSPATSNLMIYARKNGGKTKLTFSIPGTHACISFDNKSKPIRDSLPKERQKDIHIFNGWKYMDRSSAESFTMSSNLTWRYIRGLIEEMPVTDWIVIDGGERFELIAEQVMRYNQGLGAFEGFKNLNIWKERRLIIGRLYDLCQEKARLGVIWTSYIDKDIEIKNGEIIKKKDVPKWIGAVLMETDIVVKTYSDDESGNIDYFAIVESNKTPEAICIDVFGGIPKERMKINITNKGFETLLEKPEKKKGKEKEEEEI